MQPGAINIRITCPCCRLIHLFFVFYYLFNLYIFFALYLSTWTKHLKADKSFFLLTIQLLTILFIYKPGEHFQITVQAYVHQWASLEPWESVCRHRFWNSSPPVKGFRRFDWFWFPVHPSHGSVWVGVGIRYVDSDPGMTCFSQPVAPKVVLLFPLSLYSV